jgi:hypothetical protein
VKKELPAGPLTWNGNRFKRDQNGNFRFVYSGQDARAGQNRKLRERALNLNPAVAGFHMHH